MRFNADRPFQPFTVPLVNGDRFQVDHPEALVIRDGIAVFMALAACRILDHVTVSRIVSEFTVGESAPKDPGIRVVARCDSRRSFVPAEILDGRALAQQIRRQVADEVAAFTLKPGSSRA